LVYFTLLRLVPLRGTQPRSGDSFFLEFFAKDWLALAIPNLCLP
jgi:hypothetical protein